MKEHIKNLIENRYKIREDFIKAYLAQEYIDNKKINIKDYEVIEQKKDNNTIIFYVQKKENK